jgi:hypothetical protein
VSVSYRSVQYSPVILRRELSFGFAESLVEFDTTKLSLGEGGGLV